MTFDEMSRYLTVMRSFLYVTEVVRDPFSKVCTLYYLCAAEHPLDLLAEAPEP